MINTNIKYIPAYTTREFMNMGLHKEKSLYKYRFTPEDRKLLLSGAVKLFPQNMYEYTSNTQSILNGVRYDRDEILDPSDFEENTLNTLIKTNIINCDLKEEYKNDIDKAIKEANLYELIGKTFNYLSQQYNIDYEVLKETFELKQGGSNKKIKEEDLEKIVNLI